MYFRILHDDASGELTYLLADLDAREAVLIDPRGRDLPVLLALLSVCLANLRPSSASPSWPASPVSSKA